MEAPALPGFYFDKEKGKYFAVQADHKLPPNAKHAYGNIVKEQRASKRRAADVRKRSGKKRAFAPERIERSLLMYTLARASNVRLSNRFQTHDHRVLQAIHARELGDLRLPRVGSSLASALCYEESVLTVPIHADHSNPNYPTSCWTAAIPGPQHEELYVFDILTLKVYGWHNLCTTTTTELFQREAQNVGRRIRASNSSGGIYITQCWPSNLNVQRVYEFSTYSIPVIAWRTYEFRPHQNHRCDPDYHDLTVDLGTIQPPVPFDLSNIDYFSVMQTSPDGRLLLAGSVLALIIIDMRTGTLVNAVHFKEDSCGAMAWISNHLLAVGVNGEVKLWDIRHDAEHMTTRFEMYHYVIGIRSLNDHQIIVASNHELRIFDVRMSNKRIAAYGWDMRQELDGALMDVNDQGIIALYAEQCVVLLSTRTGRSLQWFEVRGTQRGALISDLRWCLDANGVPYVQLCIGSKIIRLSPSTHDGDELRDQGVSVKLNSLQ